MSLQFLPFEVSDLDAMDVQARHRPILEMAQWAAGQIKKTVEGPYSWTAWTPYGQAVAACGILEDGHAWAFLGTGSPKHYVAITRKVRQVLECHVAIIGPVYAAIDPNHPEAVRWARLLGFRPEGTKWVFDASV